MPCSSEDRGMSCSSWMLFFSLGGIRMNCSCHVDLPSKLKSCACQANSATLDSSTSTVNVLVPSAEGRGCFLVLAFRRVPCRLANRLPRCKLRTAKSPGCSRWYSESSTSTWHSKCQAPPVRNHFKSFTAAAGVHASPDTAEAWTWEPKAMPKATLGSAREGMLKCPA